MIDEIIDKYGWYIIIISLILDIVVSICIYFFENDLFWMIIYHWYLMFLCFIIAMVVAFVLRDENENPIVIDGAE